MSTHETTPAGAPDPEWDALIANASVWDGDGFRPTAAATVAVNPLPEVSADPAGTTPLTPAWVKSGAGWKGRGRVARINSVHGFRRWVRRQGGEHGHSAQVWRGLARTTRWVKGVEGADIDRAKHEARRAQEAYRAARRAHAHKLIPGDKKNKLARAMDDASQDSAAAMAALAKVRKATRARRAWRASAVAAPLVAAEVGSVLALGDITNGSLATTAATAFVLALIGRRTDAGETWQGDSVSLGDGGKLTDETLNAAYRDAGVLKDDQVLKLLSPVALTRDGDAYEVVFDLPSGMPTDKALSAVKGLASAMGVSITQVHQGRGEREGRIHLRVNLRIPFTGKPSPGPLLTAGRMDLFKPVPMGVSMRGKAIETDWVERSGLFGGEPGAGKSAAVNNVLLAAALDPHTRLYLADGKAGFDLVPFEGIAEMIDTAGDPEALLAILTHVWEVEVPARRAALREHGARKVSAELAAKDPRLALAILFVDEWASYVAGAPAKLREELNRLFQLIVSQGRALGVASLAATQKPSSDSVPTSVRDLLSVRWAMRCMTPEASDTILGKGYASAGQNAQTILKTQRGVGILMSGESAEPELVRGHYYSDAEVEQIIERATELRTEAGTMPGMAPVGATAPAAPRLLDHLIAAVTATGRGVATKGEVLAYLAGVDPQFGAEDGESEAQFRSRAGKLLAEWLDAEGLEVPTPKVDGPDGKRSLGYRLDDLSDVR
ncbi:FtsK/SpoIIIE domain-containing protein [Streptomyces roseolus]|uniref:FtsK/SpoIIIE domain-containing protein n=1 Tax=Streptomyces roseolus TaxID=67358 RepID=UPI00362C379C